MNKAKCVKVERKVKGTLLVNGCKHKQHFLPFCDVFFFFVCSLRLLVAPLVEGTAVPLMQCPYYQYTVAHFANLRRMTG